MSPLSAGFQPVKGVENEKRDQGYAAGDNVTLDFDGDGRLVGLDVMDASKVLPDHFIQTMP